MQPGAWRWPDDHQRQSDSLKFSGDKTRSTGAKYATAWNTSGCATATAGRLIVLRRVPTTIRHKKSIYLAPT
jgi:hypothetical protein